MTKTAKEGMDTGSFTLNNKSVITLTNQNFFTNNCREYLKHHL
jgi:hypothetical protein